MAPQEYESWTGGKFRKRPLRRAPATPYDRPASAARGGVQPAAAAAGSGGWLSKLVDPASRLITDGASRIFSSFFRKRLPAPPVAPEENYLSRQEVPEVASTNPSSELVDGNGSGGDTSTNHFDIDGVPDLEKLLKQKTFTWVESEHLMELLRSRTIDPVTLKAAVNNEIDAENASAQEYVEGKSGLYKTLPNSARSLTSPEDEAISPAELTKTYVDSRLSTLSPLTLRRGSLALQEDTYLRIPYVSTPLNRSVAPRPFIRSSGTLPFSENGLQTPKTHGRSAICRLSCSPYFKVQSTSNTKGGRAAEDGYSGSVSSNSMSRNLMQSRGKLVLKRRRSVLDSDVGTFGPIRRIRQRSSLMSSKAYPSPLLIKDVVGGSAFIHRPSRLDEPKYQNTYLQYAENKDNKSYVSVTPVPAKSSETALKILQQLDKLVPPKERSTEHKATGRNESPSKLAHDRSTGEALKSLKDFTEFFTSPGSSSLDPNGNSRLLIQGSPLSEKHYKPEENGILDSAAIASAVIHSKDANFVISGASTEDVSIADNDSLNARNSSGAVSTKVDNIEAQLLTDKSAVSEITFTEKYLRSSPKSKAVSGSLLSREAEMKASAMLTAAPSYSCQPLSTSSLNMSALQDEQAAPFFRFASKVVQTMTSSSSTTSFADTAGQNIVASDVGDLKIEKSIREKKVGEIFGNAVSSGMAASTASSCVSFGSSATSCQSNGLLHLSPLAPPVAATPAETLSDNLVSSVLSTSTASTSNMSRPSTSSTTHVISTVNLFQFGAGSLAAPVSVSHPVKESNSTNMETSAFINNNSSAPCKSAFSEISGISSDLMRSPAFSSSGTSSSVPATEVACSSAGSSIGLAPLSAFSSTGKDSLVYSATEQLSTPSYSSQNTIASFGVTAGSTSSFQSTQSGSGNSNASQSLSQFDLMTSSPFGPSNPSSGFGSSPFVSATLATNPFASSVPPFTNVSLSCVPGTSFTTVPAAATSLFCSSSHPSTSSVFGHTFASSTSSLSTEFSAGVSFASGSSSLTAGSSTGSMFSFTSSGGATSHTSLPLPVFGMPTSSSGFASGSPGNDQMNVEGSTAHVTSSSGLPANSIAAASPMFSSTVPTGGPAIFKFGSSQSPSCPLPFQGGSLGFTPAGSFNMGSGGGESGDKSGRRIIKVKRDKVRKK